MKKFFTYIILSSLSVGLNACSSVGELGYMDRNDVSEFAGYEPIDEIRYTNHKVGKSVKTLGAISVTKFNQETSEDEKTIMKIKRHRSFFYAEANLYESSNKEKSFFDESVFNFGVDRKTKGLNMELSFKF